MRKVVFGGQAAGERGAGSRGVEPQPSEYGFLRDELRRRKRRPQRSLDEARDDPTVAFALAQLQHPESPVPLGVLRAVNRPTYDTLMDEQVEEAVSGQGAGNLEALLAGQDTWTVE